MQITFQTFVPECRVVLHQRACAEMRLVEWRNQRVQQHMYVAALGLSCRIDRHSCYVHNEKPRVVLLQDRNKLKINLRRGLTNDLLPRDA